jgi:Protein of unknown function (DUF2897)
MLKVIIIFVIVFALLVGGMLALRTSRNTGMPDEDVLKRAAQRAREQKAKDEAER